MKIAYNPTTAAALTAAPSNNDITFDLKGVAIYAKGVKFKGTDTTYSIFKKHTASGNTGGYNGLVPVPSYTTTAVRFLREDGSWVTPTNTTYSVVSSTANGLAPAIGTTCSTTIATQADEWVLTSTKGGTPTWRKLPANAFKNDNINTTYTLSGGLSGNNYTVTLTPSSGSATTATIPAMTGATSSVAGKAGLVPAPGTANTGQFLKGDGTWATPSDTHWTTHLYIGAKDAASNAETTNGNTYIKVTDNSTIRNQYIIKGAGRATVASDASGNITITSPTVTWSEISGKPSTFAPSAHNHPTSQINALTSYTKATAAAALATTDSLNAALGKLEYKLDVAYDLVTKANDSDGTIENLKEILDVLAGIKDTETIKAIIGKYLPLAGGTMNNGAIVKFNANGSIIQTTATTSNASAMILWYKGTAKDANYSYAAQIGWHNTGDTDGAIYLVPNPQNSSPWEGGVGLYIGKTLFKWNNNAIIHAGNYTTYTVKKDGTGASGTWGISITGNAASATKITVRLHTGNDIEYPLVWTNESNANSNLADLLYKSYNNLMYNPKNNRITASIFKGNLQGNATSATTATDWSRSVSWNAITTVNAWSRILKISGYSNILLTVNYSQDSLASLHLYLVSTGYQTGNISLIGYNKYSSWSKVQVRLTRSSNTVFYVEIYNTYGHNSATTVTFGCRATNLSIDSAIEVYKTYTAGGNTVIQTITSSHEIASNFNADMLDGKHLSSVIYAPNSGSALTGTSEESGKSSSVSRTTFWRDNVIGRIGVTVLHSESVGYGWTINTGYSGTRFYTNIKSNGTWNSSEQTIAFLSDIPTSLKNPKVLTFAAGTFSAKTYDGSSAVTVNVPTHTSHLTNNSGFLTQHQSLANCYLIKGAMGSSSTAWDWNSYTTLGSYKVLTGTTITNHPKHNGSANAYPYGIAYVIRGQSSDSENRTVQMYFPHSWTNYSNIPLYLRMLNGSGWTLWARIPSVEYINTTNFPGLNKTGTVTSVTVTGANGLSGTGTITTSGTITLSNAGVRSTTINGNYLRVNTNGTNADLTIPYATTASLLNNTSVSDPSKAASGQNVKWYSQISSSSGYAGTNYGFPVSNNANGILWLGTHTGPYGWQMGFSSNGRIYARYISNNSFSTAANGGSWNRIAWTSEIPTVTNYYWANVKVSASSSTSTYPTFANMKSTGRIYAGEWIEFSGNTGLYWPNTYGAHFYPNNTSTYGQFKLLGTKGDYSGILFGKSTSFLTVMSTATHHGLYHEGGGIWEFYYNSSSKGVGIRTSTITKNFNVSGLSYLSSNTWIGTTSGSEMLNVGGWVGTVGNSGWYSVTHTGGWHMSDATYIRVYGSKRVYNDNTSQYAFYTAGGMTALGHMYSASSAQSWLNGQKAETAALNIAAASDTGSYWPWFRQTLTAASKWISVGTLGNSLYFIGSTTSRTANSYDYGFRMDFSNGYLYGNFSGYLSGTASNATLASTVTVTDSNANSTYRMVWHSGNYLYSTSAIYCNPSSDYLYASSFYCGNWFRSSGSTGWYNESYGGGIYMEDSTWVRLYNNKKFYVNNSEASAIHSAGGVYVAGAVHSYANYLKSTCNGKTITIGSLNASYCHYSTDAPSHWFNKPVYVQGHVYGGSSYNRRLAYVDELPTNTWRPIHWAVYLIFHGTASNVSFSKKAGNHNFFTSGSTTFYRETQQTIVATITYPSGWDENTTMIFGNGAVSNTSDYYKPCILTIQKEYGSTDSRIRFIMSDDSTVENRACYAWVYFLCIG